VADAAKDTTGGSDQTLATATDIEAMAADLMALVDKNVPVIGNASAQSTGGGNDSKYVLAEARETVFAE